jgi:fucose permease
VTKIRKIILFILLFGIMLIFGFIENVKGVSYPLIKTEFNASWEQQGLMVSILSVSYVSFSIIAGIFLGRFGIKPSFLFGFAALVLGLVLVFFMRNFFDIAAALFLVFAGFGFFEVGLNALASSIFVKRAALLMNLLHSFYGIGAIIGPKAAGFIANNTGFGWRYVYLFSVPLALLFFIPVIFASFPGIKTSANGSITEYRRKNFFDALRTPMVWLFSVILGLAIIVEMNSSNWGPLYFQDVYGFAPRTGGAAFLSSFFIIFTISRLTCGIVVERIGYIRSLLGLPLVIFAIFICGFCLGAKGIYVLPALGFFIALLWPTIMALAVVSFGNDAPVFSSAMIAIGGTINAAVQFLIGMTNRIFGPAWGYRSSIVYAALLFGALIMLSRKLKVFGPIYKNVNAPD